jgi:23S rRNA pseudouridine2605 synthase
MRLQKFLADCGVGSRRACEALIRSGKVRVNGELAFIGQSVNPDVDAVEVNGKIVSPKRQKFVYLLLHKPRGYLSTVFDPQKRKTILDLVKITERVYPVGRLDKDSEGLVLLTNDGDLAYRLMHPKFQVEKTYEVWVKGVPTNEVLEKLRKGILLEDGMTASCQASIKKNSEGKEKALLEIKLHEGKKREIRRMMEKLGHPVLSLCRVAMGPLVLSNLPSGKWRKLSLKEVQNLKRWVENV